MFLQLNFRSAALKSETTVNILLPNPTKVTGKIKTLWLLHGLSGNHNSWMRQTSIERYAAERGLAVIMPDVGRSWYTDTAYEENYFTFVAKELPTLCRETFRCLSERREDNLVAGLSMGGYGALKLALTCPEQYGACISLSGSLDITRRGRACNLNEWKAIFGFDLPDPTALDGSAHDLFALAEQNKAEGKPFPKLYLWCGTEDSLLTANRNFDALLTRLGVEHRFDTSEGDHSWKWWDMHICPALEYGLCDEQ